MPIGKLREQINIWLYDTKENVLRVTYWLNIIISFSAISLMVYYYGYPHNTAEEATIFKFLEGSFAFYILRFGLKFVYDFAPIEFIKKNWLEGIIMLLLSIEGISYNLFDVLLFEPIFVNLGFNEFANFSTIFVQLFILVILVNNLIKKSDYISWIKIHPALLFTTSILLLTFGGAFLYSLPEMSNEVGGLNFTDSLFLAMSSVSVTGLSTVDIPATFTFKGQMIMLVLIKLGGLNTIAFGAILVLVAKFGVGIKHHEVIEDFVNSNSTMKTDSMLKKIIIWSTSIEILGITALYFAFGDEGIFADSKTRIYHAIFHGVSGFNNAGLSILKGGMMHPDVAQNYLVHIIIGFLFFLGGLGMMYVIDIFSFSAIKERRKRPWKKIEFGTKISLYFTLILLAFGAVVFFIFEQNNTLSSTNFLEDIVISLYESMTTRNAGFNIIDTSAISVPVLIVFLFLMFIGASSGSAGGGIRTSTFAIMCASVVATIQGKKYTELFKRTISNDVVLKAYAIFMFFVIGNFIGPFILALTEADLLASGKYDFMDIVFEHVSAASTVGLSTGLSADMSTPGKYVLILAMFIGRVGTLTLAYLVGKKLISKNYKYPIGHTMVG